MADLFVQGDRAPEPRQLVAVYDYCDWSGEVIAQKIRMIPKAFRWRRPDPTMSGKWLYDLNGVRPGLYRIEALMEVKQVFCLEGEKAVDLFWKLGLPACCPPAGASRWEAEWSADLCRAGCRELVVLPDADRTGVKHAERVAASCYEIAIPDGGEALAVKIVSLPGLTGGTDAYDWLRGLGSTLELLQIVSEASCWEPGALERARAERKRRLTRLRVSRFRHAKRARLEGVAFPPGSPKAMAFPVGSPFDLRAQKGSANCP